MLAGEKMQAVKKKAYMAINQDGLETLQLGFVLGIIALYLFFPHLLWVFLAILPVWWLVKAMRKWFTYPRTGYAKFPQKMKEKTIMGIIIAAMYVASALAAHWLGSLLPLYLAAVMIAGALFDARVLGDTSGYALIPVFAASGILGMVLHVGGPERAAAIQLWAVAAILIPLGLARFFYFLHKYPSATEEESYV